MRVGHNSQNRYAHTVKKIHHSHGHSKRSTTPLVLCSWHIRNKSYSRSQFCTFMPGCTSWDIKLFLNSCVSARRLQRATVCHSMFSHIYFSWSFLCCFSYINFLIVYTTTCMTSVHVFYVFLMNITSLFSGCGTQIRGHGKKICARNNCPRISCGNRCFGSISISKCTFSCLMLHDLESKLNLYTANTAGVSAQVDTWTW